MNKIEFAAEKDFAELTDTANRIFTGKEEDGRYIYNEQFFQTIMSKLYKDPGTAENHLVIRDGNKITGMVGLIPNTIHTCGQTLKTIGIGTVGTVAACRGHGYMSEMMCAALAYMRRTQTDISFLGGKRQRYEHFGYTAAGICASFELTKQNLDSLCGKAATASYGFYEMTGCGTAAELALISRLHSRKAWYFERELQKLANILHTWENQVFLITQNGTLAGYLVGRDEGICEIEYEPDCNLCEILSAYMQYRAAEHLTIYGMGLFTPEKTALLSRCAEDQSLRSPSRVLILNYTNVLSALLQLKSRYVRLCDGHLSVRVLSGDVAEQFEIIVENGNPTVMPHVGAPVLELSTLEATQLFCGFGSMCTAPGYTLPACAAGWFPLPLHIESPDMV